MPRFRLSCSAIVAAAGMAHADLTVVNQFSVGGTVGLAYDHGTGNVWTYPEFGAELRRYSPTGTLLGSVPRPGESANDADVEFTIGPMTLAGVPLPDATLLFINGETGPAEIYAIDKSSGAVLATLTAAFGSSHVVGGAHHPQRGTLFLVQDRVPSGTGVDNLVAEVNPNTGAVIQSWYTTTAAPGFTVNFGDIEIAGNGNVLIVSSDESAVGEFTPTGTLVGLRPYPAGVSAPAGIGVNAGACEWWVASNAGQVTRLGGLQGDPVCGTCYPNCDGSTTVPVLNVLDFACFLNRFASGDSYANCDGSSTPPTLNVLDFACFLNAFAAGCP